MRSHSWRGVVETMDHALAQRVENLLLVFDTQWLDLR
jgi:hypothetical protein